MDFFFGGGDGKNSVVGHAQKVVADLEVTLNEKNETINKLQVSRSTDPYKDDS